MDAGAALTYFDKSVNELTIAESAYLASLPKGPANYNPFRRAEAALTRRNWVIDRMVENGYVSQSDGEEAKKQPLGVVPPKSGPSLFASDYFAEEVRRQLIDQYGEKTLYEGGLSVRTSLDPQMQLEARKALQDALVDYDQRRGYRGPIKQIATAQDWGAELAKVPGLSDVPEWQVAVVLSVSDQEADIGLQPRVDAGGKVSPDRKRGTIAAADMRWAFRAASGGKVAKSPNGVLSAGDVVFVQKTGSADSTTYRLRQPPKVQGGLVAMDPHTGRVLAMVGGFSYAQSEFNRATQAKRQPGSSFKPFVYAAAMDNGYTPASVILDDPLQITLSNGDVWKPTNYEGEGGGVHTLRFAIEKSRNLMTVRLASDMGMPLVAEYAERFGIYDHMNPVLAMSLGAGETTVLRMVSAYSVIANGGKQIKPTLIDRIQDRYGKTIFKHEERVCDTCNVSAWQNQDEPAVADNREQVLDPMTAYQVTSMMQGVIIRGTAAGKIKLNTDVAGKTGTTNDEKDAWFVGFTPSLVAGLYIGYDTPTPLGRGGTGSGLAAPVFNEFMQAATKDEPPEKFQVPAGMTMVAVNRATGMAAQPGDQGAIMEAFKPGTGPATSLQVIGGGEAAQVAPEEILRTSPQANQAVTSGAGGLF